MIYVNSLPTTNVRAYTYMNYFVLMLFQKAITLLYVVQVTNNDSQRILFIMYMF